MTVASGARSHEARPAPRPTLWEQAQFATASPDFTAARDVAVARGARPYAGKGRSQKARSCIAARSAPISFHSRCARMS